VAKRLTGTGLHAVQPEIGEFATSFEMAGVSLTLTWLDEELEQAWRAPAAAPGYQRGACAPVVPVVAAATGNAPSSPSDPPSPVRGSADSRRAAAGILGALRAVHRVIEEHSGELGRLDAVAGDGDHGIGMHRGATAAVAAARAAVRAGAGAQTTLQAAAGAWSDRAGGTSGALWGLGLSAIAVKLGDDRPLDALALTAGIREAADAIAAAGHARLGDKTMLDALVPFAERLNVELASGLSLDEAWRSAADLAVSAAAATSGMTARAGRARSHGQRSTQVPDPGATSLALAVRAVAETLTPTGVDHHER
jgi:dihydroxyacetone kinase